MRNSLIEGYAAIARLGTDFETGTRVNGCMVLKKGSPELSYLLVRSVHGLAEGPDPTRVHATYLLGLAVGQAMEDLEFDLKAEEIDPNEFKDSVLETLEVYVGDTYNAESLKEWVCENVDALSEFYDQGTNLPLDFPALVARAIANSFMVYLDDMLITAEEYAVEHFIEEGKLEQ